MFACNRATAIRIRSAESTITEQNIHPGVPHERGILPTRQPERLIRTANRSLEHGTERSRLGGDEFIENQPNNAVRIDSVSPRFFAHIHKDISVASAQFAIHPRQGSNVNHAKRNSFDDCRLASVRRSESHKN